MSTRLMQIAMVFVVGFIVGNFYHHVADAVQHTPHDDGDGGAKMHAVEARLSSLEQALVRNSAAASSSLPAAALPIRAATPEPEAPPTPRKSRRNRAAAAARLETAAVDADGCPGGRKPVHVVLTAQDSLYQAWQTRIMYYHLRKIQKANPCTELTGFTRMLNAPGAKPDALMDEMPTVVVHALDGGGGCRGDPSSNTCDMGFPVMNRPHGVTQLLEQLPPSLTEEYVLIAETDHILLRDIPNRATPSRPVCYPFHYMNAKAKELRPVVQRFVDDPDVVDPCGPSPTIIHLPMLRRMTPEWLSLSFELKRDPQADKVFGWVLEMWGYTLAAARLGIRHLVMEELQAEPSALWNADMKDHGSPHIYHYTFGLEYSLDGVAVSGVGAWSLDKRHFMSHYPPRNLEPPPRCAGRAAHTLHALFNEASAALPQWPATKPTESHRGTLGWLPGSTAALSEQAFHASPVARAAVSRGPWSWGGARIHFFRGGRLHTPWGSGTWGLASDAIHAQVGECGHFRLAFDAARTRFSATRLDGGAAPPGHLLAAGSDEAAAKAIALDSESWAGVGADGFADGGSQLLGTGPWSWTGVAPVAFLAGGRLHTPWGPGTWGAHGDGDRTVFANFVGEEHIVRFDECFGFASTRKRDGDQASGRLLLDPPAKVCPPLTKR